MNWTACFILGLISLLGGHCHSTAVAKSLRRAKTLPQIEDSKQAPTMRRERRRTCVASRYAAVSTSDHGTEYTRFDADVEEYQVADTPYGQQNINQDLQRSL
ncbi:hypothetical protein C8R48DRAFT_51812 [Suillus tomentosus]|nr:hypothetical protein C8R48DRAFT_51812 [Suillus tomentosus]